MYGQPLPKRLAQFTSAVATPVMRYLRRNKTQTSTSKGGTARRAAPSGSIKRFRKVLNKGPPRRKRIQVISRQLANKPTNYDLVIGSRQCLLEANKKAFHEVDEMKMNDLATLNRIFVSKGYTNSERGVIITRQRVIALMKNQSDVGLYVTVHRVRVRNHVNNLGSHITAGWADKFAAGSSTTQEMHTELYMNDLLLKYAQPIGKETHLLQPAQTKKLVYIDKAIRRKTYHYKEFTETVTDSKGTIITIIELHGVPTHDGTTSSNIGTTSGVLDIFVTKQTHYIESDPLSNVAIVGETDNITDPAAPVTFRESGLAEGAVET